MKEKLNLSSEEARLIVYNDHADFEVVEDKITGHSRWSIHFRIVIRRLSDGKLFSDTYRKGATECQDLRPFEDKEPDFEEVKAVEKTVIVYE